jgi:hypothetical protein
MSALALRARSLITDSIYGNQNAPDVFGSHHKARRSRDFLDFGPKNAFALRKRNRPPNPTHE